MPTVKTLKLVTKSGEQVWTNGKMKYWLGDHNTGMHVTGHETDRQLVFDKRRKAAEEQLGVECEWLPDGETVYSEVWI